VTSDTARVSQLIEITQLISSQVLSGLAAGVKLAELRHNPIDGELAEE
jgi:hypothetical protein